MELMNGSGQYTSVGNAVFTFTKSVHCTSQDGSTL